MLVLDLLDDEQREQFLELVHGGSDDRARRASIAASLGGQVVGVKR